MSNFGIGLSGLDVAQRAIELIGTNMSNATTPGYHRQDLMLSSVQYNSLTVAAPGGVQIDGVRRAIDQLLEQEIVRQQATLGYASQEVSTLQTIENSLGDVDDNSLNLAISEFFSSMRELASQPDSVALRQQVTTSADTMAGQFRSLSDFFANLQNQIKLKVQSQVQTVNQLSARIAVLNGQVADITNRGGTANLLMDQRDQAIKDLAELVDVRVERTHENGSVDLYALNTPIVSGTNYTEFESGQTLSGLLGVAPMGSLQYQTGFDSGQVGAMLGIFNDMVGGLIDKLDTLSGEIASAVNSLHVQGIGRDGSFTELLGMSRSDGTLAEWDAGVKAGELNVRVTNTATGQVTRTRITIVPAAQTLADVAASLSAINGISAGVVSGALHIEAEDGYKFDFLPAVMAQSDQEAITGTAEPSFSGIYTGATNQTYQFTVKGTGQIGVASNLQIEVKDAAGQVIKMLDVGVGYSAGDPLEVAGGLVVSLGTGTLNDGDTFQSRALIRSDTSGLLTAAGLNTFFTGDSARTLALRGDILEHPDLIATSTSGQSLDNTNIGRMAALMDGRMAGLDDMTPLEYIRKFVTDIGQMAADRTARQETADNLINRLTQQRDTVSGVDINEEAASLLVYQRMYQGMAKFLTIQDQVLNDLMEIT